MVQEIESDSSEPVQLKNQYQICSEDQKDKTPVVAKKTLVNKLKSKSNCVTDSPLTPMASYGDMDTPNLKEELKRYGVKPLSKKQSVKKLIEIYQFTHRKKLKRAMSCVDLKSACGEPVGTGSSKATTSKGQILKK